jgi:prepilin-type N-terminal cleavage/methylation domain-containing protein
MTTPRQFRRGFTLIEIAIALIIVGIIGAAFTKLLTSQSRFFDQQTNIRKARSVARNSMNVMLSDLRMVQDSGGIDSAASDGKLIRIKVPYRFGLVCATNGTITTVSMLPSDSSVVAMAKYGGFAWRDTLTGRYTIVTPAAPLTSDAPVASAVSSRCTGTGVGQAALRTFSVNGRTSDILDLNAPAATGAQSVSPVFFWQRVSYSFRASNAYSGYLGLYRNVQGTASDTTEEILAPFDTSARFRFYTSGADTSVVVPPAVSSIVGIDLVLNAMSSRVVSNNVNSHSMSKVRTSVFFKNVRSF